MIPLRASGIATTASLAVAALLLLAGLARAQDPNGPPLHISADNMSGSHGPEGDIVLLSGHVVITRERTTLHADRGRYLRQQGLLFLEGNVQMEDSTTTVMCDRASYAENTDVVELSGNVRLKDREAELKAPAATYDRRRGRADLYGGVHGSDKDQRLVCDRAIYYRDSMLVQARGNVRGSDEKNHLDLTATAIDYDRATHEAVATGEPALSAKQENGHVAVLRAKKLRLNTETRIAEAIDSVRVDRDTLQARGEYGLFDDKAQRGWLLGRPRAWDDETTVNGDTLEMWTEGRDLKRVVVRGNATMDYRGARPGSVGETSRLVGDRVDVYFKGEGIDSLVALGKARNEYRGAQEKGLTAERNLSQGDSITVFFRDTKIDRARVTGKATGEYWVPVKLADSLDAPKELVKYDASEIGYLVGKNRIVLDRAAHLTYRDLELSAQRVEYDIQGQSLVANGNPELVDRGDKVNGHIMTYDLESRVGNIYRAETAYEKALYHGERIQKRNDNELDVLNGSYSTCTLESPHYHFAAHWMKIYLKDKLVAKPIVFYIKHVPLLALPFWIFPIKPGRHSGFMFPQFELGFNNHAGQFIRNAGYYWAPNDYMDLTLSGDYYQAEPSWVMRAEGVYRLLYVLDGSFRGSFARDENPLSKRDDWDFTADHSQALTPDTRLVARASFISSKNYNSSDLYGRSLSQRLNRILRSGFSLAHNADWASLNLTVERQEYLDADDVITDPDGEGPLQGPPPGTLASLPNLDMSIPTLSLAFPTRTIGSVGFLKGTRLEKALSTLYFSLDSRFVGEKTRRGVVRGYRFFDRETETPSGDSTVVVTTPDSTTTIDHIVTTRRGFATDISLSDSRRAFGWLNLRPSLSGTAVVFDHDVLGHKIVPTGVWSSALTSSASFYGTFRPHLGALQGIRHVVFPSVSLTYSPEFKHLTYVDSAGVRRNRFESFGGIGVSGFKNLAMSFGLDQRFQAKLVHGDKVQKLENLLSWNMSGAYNFLWREQHQKHPLTPINSTVFLQPPSHVSASLDWVTDVYSPRPVRSLGYNVNLNLASHGQGRRGPGPLPIDHTTTRPEDYETPDEDESFAENWTVDVAYSYSGGYPGTSNWSSNQTANLVFRCQLTPAWSLDYSASYDVTQHEVGTQHFSLSRDLHCWQATFSRTFAPGGEAEYYFRLGVKDQREIFIERGNRSGSIGGIQ